MLHILLSPWISLSFVKLPPFSCTMLHFHTVLLALHNSYEQAFEPWSKSPAIQQLTAFPELNPPTSCYGSHSSLTCSTCTQPVTKICEFPYTSLLFPLHHISILQTPLPLQYSFHIFCMQNSLKTLDSPFSLLYIYRASIYRTVNTKPT